MTDLETAALLGSDQPDRAIAAAEAAHLRFTELGAHRLADQAAGLLRQFGVRGQTGPKRRGRLTGRESDVLDLIAHGFTNAEIGERLFISTKTAANHVSNVLAKLGARSRTEAAALALRRAGDRPTDIGNPIG